LADSARRLICLYSLLKKRDINGVKQALGAHIEGSMGFLNLVIDSKDAEPQGEG